MVSDSDHVVDELLRWCAARDIQIDARIRVARGEDGGICVLSRDAFIEHPTTLVSIPKSAILSIRKCLLAEHIPQVIYGTEAQMGLALGLYGEILRGDSSPWAGYLQSLPKDVKVALLWNYANEDEQTALNWIKGTMVEVERTASAREVAPGIINRPDHTVMVLLQYYEFTALPALSKVKLDEHATLEGYKYTFALVSSRSFIVDAYHGLAMVPIADAFNHITQNHVHLESDHQVCHICGSLSECPHDSEDEEGGDRMAAMTERTLSGLNNLEDTCDMVTNDPVPPFNEVFNTYGEHLSNAQLLVRYGFMLDVNENDVICWDTEELARFAESFLVHASDGENCIDAWPTSKDHDPDFLKVKRSEITGETDTHGQQSIHVGDARPSLRAADSDIGEEDQIFKISSGQTLLKHLREMLGLWACDHAVCTNSNLVYFPIDQDQEAATCLDSYWEDARVRSRTNFAHEMGSFTADRSMDASNENAGARKQANTDQKGREGRRLQPLFAVNDECKISHYLWIFCVLVALHAERVRTHNTASTDADQIQISHEECAFNLPRENERSTFSLSPVDARRTERKGPGLFGEDRDETKAVHNTLSKIAEENVVLLQRILPIQMALEILELYTESNADTNIVGEMEPFLEVSSSDNCAMKSEEVNGGMSTTPVVEGSEQGPPEASVVSSLSITSAVPQRVVPSGSSRKRTRSRSKSSSSSSQDDGARSRIRFGRNRNPGVKNAIGTPEAPSEVIEDDGKENIETKSSAPKEPSPVASRRSRRRDEGFLSTLLHDYGDDSDNSDNDGSDSEAKDSPVSGRSQEKVGLDGLGNANDMDTAVIAKLTCTPQKEIDTSDHRNRRISTNSGMSTSTFATPPNDAEETQNVPNGRDSAFTLRDASLIRVVASTAHIVSALCAARTRRMVHPDLSAAELGDAVDNEEEMLVDSEVTSAGDMPANRRLETRRYYSPLRVDVLRSPLSHHLPTRSSVASDGA